MLQYYTLEEAARVLSATADQAKKLLDTHRVRQYRDGSGKVRYVASSVDELARTLGLGSNPGLSLGETEAAAPAPRTPAPRSGGPKTPVPAPKTPAPAKAEDPGIFDFSLGESEDVPLGADLPQAAGSGSAARKSGAAAGGAGTPTSRPRTPAPKPGTDSDVRLVGVGSDPDVTAVPASSSRPGSSRRGAGSAGPEVVKGDSDARKSKPVEAPEDSDVRMVSDSSGHDVLSLGGPPPKTHSDSDIRLETGGTPIRDDSSDSIVTDEIDLDAEQQRAEAAKKPKSPGSKLRPAGPSAGAAVPPTPATSPFELSDSDLSLPAAGPSKNASPDDSSDFELSPAAESSGDLPAMVDEDEVALGEHSTAKGPGQSGINLRSPADSGISLESDESSDEIEFELSLDAGATPKPKPAATDDSDSEFELSLDAEGSSETPALAADESSEFELTLDDSGSAAPLVEEDSGEAAGDIFEDQDFDVPALEEESGSEAVALDDSGTDVESSEFDLALGEEDMAADEESGSQVVALEDEADVDESADTVARPRKAAAAAGALAEEDVEELLDEDADEEEEAAATPAAARTAAPAAATPWGVLPAILLLPAVVILLLAGLMSYELITSTKGYRPGGKASGFLTDAIARMFMKDSMPPKD